MALNARSPRHRAALPPAPRHGRGPRTRRAAACRGRTPQQLAPMAATRRSGVFQLLLAPPCPTRDWPRRAERRPRAPAPRGRRRRARQRVGGTRGTAAGARLACQRRRGARARSVSRWVRRTRATRGASWRPPPRAAPRRLRGTRPAGRRATTRAEYLKTVLTRGQRGRRRGTRRGPPGRGARASTRVAASHCRGAAQWARTASVVGRRAVAPRAASPRARSPKTRRQATRHAPCLSSLSVCLWGLSRHVHPLRAHASAPLQVVPAS